MKFRILLALALLTIAPVLGCGGPGSPTPTDPSDRSNMPPEVAEAEAKFEADNAKRAQEYTKRTGQKR